MYQLLWSSHKQCLDLRKPSISFEINGFETRITRQNTCCGSNYKCEWDTMTLSNYWLKGSGQGWEEGGETSIHAKQNHANLIHKTTHKKGSENSLYPTHANP